MSVQPVNIWEKRAGKIALDLRASGVDYRYLHSAARHLLSTGQGTRDSEVVKEAKRRRQMVLDAVTTNCKRLGLAPIKADA
jgi:hypothetical protein